ncbi:MAG: DUF1559 domain-containing protein [Thermoguttaceae bacterium]
MSYTTENATQIVQESMPNKTTRRFLPGCLKKCLVLFLIAVLLFVYFGINFRPLRISKETTYVTGPLKSDGRLVDYFRAMEESVYPKEMKTDDNGYRLLVEAFGDWDNDGSFRNSEQTEDENQKQREREQYRLQLYEKLGLDPNVPPTMDIPKDTWLIDNFFEKRAATMEGEDEKSGVWTQYFKLSEKPWTLEEYPDMQEWVEVVDQPLDVIAQAVRKPTFCPPWLRRNENEPMFQALTETLDTIQSCRSFARTFNTRSNYRLGTGDIDGAIDDKISALRLGRHIGHHGMLIDYLVGLAIEGISVYMPVEYFAEQPLSSEQWEKLQREMDALPPRSSFKESLNRERLFGLGACQDMLFGQQPSEKSLPVPFGLALTCDPNVLMQNINHWYDRFYSDENLQDGKIADRELQDKQRSLLKNPFSYLTIRGRSQMISDVLVALLIPAVHAGQEAERRIQCAENMLRLTIALNRYQQEHGSFPEGNWKTAILPYLGENGERYFQCPTAGLPADETVYALVRQDEGEEEGGGADPTSILLVELATPQKIGEPTEPFVLPNKKLGIYQEDGTLLDGLAGRHGNSTHIARRNGSVGGESTTLTQEEVNERR